MGNISRIKTGGRKLGTPNKVSRDVRRLAMTHANDAINALVGLMSESANETVRLQAAREILDRSCGKVPDAAAVQRAENFENRGGKPMTLDEMLKMP